MEKQHKMGGEPRPTPRRCPRRRRGAPVGSSASLTPPIQPVIYKSGLLVGEIGFPQIGHRHVLLSPSGRAGPEVGAPPPPAAHPARDARTDAHGRSFDAKSQDASSAQGVKVLRPPTVPKLRSRGCTSEMALTCTNERRLAPTGQQTTRESDAKPATSTSRSGHAHEATECGLGR